MQKHQNKKKTGFTLLETLIALSVILAAVVGPVSLITKGLADFSFSKNKLIAANLAQEGIELVRSIRENNVICDSLNGAVAWPWNEDPEPPNPPGGNTFTNLTAGVAIDRVTTINCGVGEVFITVPILSSSCSEKLRYDPATGLYGYTGAQETIFSRCVTIRVPPESPDAGIDAGEQMDIVSVVQWDEKQLQKSLILRERLYNWR